MNKDIEIFNEIISSVEKINSYNDELVSFFFDSLTIDNEVFFLSELKKIKKNNSIIIEQINENIVPYIK